jgi:hypothetical protein
MVGEVRLEYTSKNRNYRNLKIRKIELGKDVSEYGRSLVAFLKEKKFIVTLQYASYPSR